MFTTSSFSKKNKEIFERTPSSVVDFINNWRTQAFESYKDLAASLKEEYDSLKNIIRQESSDELSFTQTEKAKEAYTNLNNFLKNSNKKYGTFAYYVFHQPSEVEDYVNKIVNNEAERKLVKFMLAIEKKAGKVICGKRLYIAPDHSINGIAICENKTVNVYSILAGGYNIQKLHFRVLVK